MAVRERRFFVGGNWKMNGNTTMIDGIIKNLTQNTLSDNSGEFFFEGHIKINIVIHDTYINYIEVQPKFNCV